MSNWIEHFYKAVDLIPYRKAGGMYNKIAEEAYQAGFEAGEEQANVFRPEPPGVGKIFNNDLIEIREWEEKQKREAELPAGVADILKIWPENIAETVDIGKISKNKALYAGEDSHPKEGDIDK